MIEDYSYLTVTSGERTGTNYMLDSTKVSQLGRGADCEVVVTDPGCSRIHARILRREGQWFVQDAESRNGTFVNDQRIDEAALFEESRIRIGTTEFTFHHSDQPPTLVTRTQPRPEHIVKETAIRPEDSSQMLLSALERGEFAHDLLLLYQLSVRLLGSGDQDDVIESSLRLLHDRTRSSVVGFLWVSDAGKLRTKFVLPNSAAEISLSDSLTEVVCEQGRAVWMSNKGSTRDASNSLRSYADAMCIPLVRDKLTLGAIHLYREEGRFRQVDFDFAISTANLMVVALVRARQEAALAADHARLVASSAACDELIGESEPMQELKGKIARVARASGVVLIRGESGSGKELVARALHRSSLRADRPLLSVNCAAIPAELMESQLFGHRKGAFTSADRDHDGWFQQADTGTLFLDEIGELTLEGQAKLLRILEGHPFLPVGATKEVSVDVRVIAATNRDLKEFVKEKRFRQDLYYRLSVFELHVPPLRERGNDIRLLINFFLSHFGVKHGRPGMTISDGALEKLLSYDWPGNVRQLRNVVDSAVVLAESNTLREDDLGLRSVDAAERPTSLKISDWEKKLIEEALKRTDGKVPEAAKLLGIGRATLYRKLDEYNIQR
ncbi:MAG: sigma 54-interacting transcriptional regulator [Pirellulaceae bacterium]